MSIPCKELENLLQCKNLLEFCKANPSFLHNSEELAFLKSFVEYFNGKIPEEKSNDSEKSKNENECKFEKTKVKAEDETEDSDLELDMTGVMVTEEVDDIPQTMGDPNFQPTETDIAESQTKRSEAVSAFVEKDYEKAIKLYTEAILLNPQTAILYAKRGQVYLVLNKPKACIRDCAQALELNPDSAAAHKFRGRANYLLGKWEEAASDLRLACKFDFDEQADEWLREATKNARKIEEHKRKKERRLKEKLERAKQEETQKAKESAKMRENNTQSSQTDPPRTFGLDEFYKTLNNPEIRQALRDPEVSEAFKEISKDPVNIFKYQGNPKIAAFIREISKIYEIDAKNMNDLGDKKILDDKYYVGGLSNHINLENLAGLMSDIPGFSGANVPPRNNPPKSPQPDDVDLD